MSQTLIKTSLVELLREMVQKSVPFAFGRVLGRYSLPVFKLKS